MLHFPSFDLLVRFWWSFCNCQCKQW